MRILLFVRSLEIGGTQRQLAALAAGLAKRGHDISVAVFYKGGPNEAALAGTSVRIIDLGKSGRWDLLRSTWRLWRLLRQERFDILYSFLPTENSFAALVAPRNLRLAFGFRAAGMRAVGLDYLSRLMYRAQVWLSRRATVIVSNSAAGRIDAIEQGMPAEKIVVVPNGVDTSRIKPDRALALDFRKLWRITNENFVIGYVARLDPMKDHQTFLKAASIFIRTQPDVRFVCIGNGDARYRDKLKSLAISFGLADSLVWAGAMENAQHVYNAFDIATQTSIAEGISNSICEAMACGIPVVATDAGDSAAIVGDLGEIVPPRRPDLVCAGWVKLRQRLANEPDLGKAARNRIVANFALDTMIERTEKILARINENRSGADVVREFR